MAETVHPYLEYTGETKEGEGGVVLRRIRATRDLPYHDVKARDIGGWVENLDNIKDNSWVGDEAQVFAQAVTKDNGRVEGRAIVCEEAIVADSAKVTEDAHVFGTTEVRENADVYGYAHVSGSSYIGGNAQVGDDSWVENSRVFDDARLVNNAMICCGSWVYGNSTIAGSIKICSDGRVSSDLDVLATSTATNNGTIDVVLHRTVNGHEIQLYAPGVLIYNGTIDYLEAILPNPDAQNQLFGEGFEDACREVEVILEQMRIRVSRWSVPDSSCAK